MTRNPYTRALFPERVTDDDGVWLYYVCSSCRVMIDVGTDDQEQLEKVFIEHVKTAHPAPLEGS